MPGGSTVKRVRVRLKATDKESLVRAFGAHLGSDSVFLTSSPPLPLGTAVILEISYATREVALIGKGHVAWVRAPAPNVTGGIAVAIEWDEKSRAVVDWVLTRLKETDPSSDQKGLKPPPVAADLLLDGPTPSGGTPAIVLGDASGPTLASDLVLDAPSPSSPPHAVNAAKAVVDAAPAKGSAIPSVFSATSDIESAFDASFIGDAPTKEMLDAEPVPELGELEDEDFSQQIELASELPLSAAPSASPPLAPPLLATPLPPLVVPPSLPESASPPPPSATEYARYDAMKDELAVMPEMNALGATDEVIPRVPARETFREDQKNEWDRQSGEVTPLARIELVRRSSSGLEMTDELSAVLEDDANENYVNVIREKSSPRRLPPKGDLVIGIDLGTTYSCAAIVEDGRARVIPSRRGMNTIPSVVLIHEGGKTIVGEPALRKQPLFPANTIVGVKRLIGRPFHSPVVQRARQRCAYEIIEGDEGEAAVRIGEHRVSLEEVSALILKEIKESASINLGQKVTRAVITCPAYYNERQRGAVRTAGELAGLHVERVLSEPTAAALNYGLGRNLGRRKMLVYDLGGGTFDASLIDVDGAVFGVVATGGETFLGGIDFDACVVQFLVQHIRNVHKVDPKDDPTALAYLYQLAEQAKRDLSDHQTARVRMAHFTVHNSRPFALDVDIHRGAVEELFEPLVRRTLDVVGDVCRRANADPALVDEVLLVGGQSRAPIVRRLLQEMFNRAPRRDIHPDEAVAVGAAQYGANMSTFDSLVLVDTLPISIGIGTPGGRFQRVIPQDTSLPARREHTIHTAFDGQTELEIVIFQGEDDDVANNELIGVLLLENLPPRPKGQVRAIVSFDLNAECMLELSATDESSGDKLDVEFITRGTPEEILARLAPLDARLNKAKRSSSLGGAIDEDDDGDGGLLSWLKKTLGGSKRKTV